MLALIYTMVYTVPLVTSQSITMFFKCWFDTHFEQSGTIKPISYFYRFRKDHGKKTKTKTTTTDKTVAE